MKHTLAQTHKQQFAVKKKKKNVCHLFSITISFTLKISFEKQPSLLMINVSGLHLGSVHQT